MMQFLNNVVPLHSLGLLFFQMGPRPSGFFSPEAARVDNLVTHASNILSAGFVCLLCRSPDPGALGTGSEALLCLPQNTCTCGVDSLTP